MIHRTPRRKPLEKIDQRERYKKCGWEFRCPGKANSSCTNSGTIRATIEHIRFFIYSLTLNQATTSTMNHVCLYGDFKSCHKHIKFLVIDLTSKNFVVLITKHETN